MSEEFLNHSYKTVFSDTSKGGLLFRFLTEYRNHFKTGKLNPACSTCRVEYWTNYINLFKIKKMEKSKYILKSKYNGINLGATGQPLRNGEFTDEQAKELLEKHPRGKELFEFIPVQEKKEVAKPRKKRATKTK